MLLTQLQISGQGLREEIGNLRDEIARASGLELSPPMMEMIEDKEDELRRKRDERREIIAQMEEVRGELGRNVCGRTGS